MKKTRPFDPYAIALSFVTGVISLVIASSYLISDNVGWESAAWAVLFAALAIVNLASVLVRAVPWAVHIAEEHRPTR